MPGDSDSYSRVIDIADHDDVYEFMFDQGMTDGLPVVPPTRERVDRMLQRAPSHWSDPQQVVATLPPNMAPMTVEKAAINAVMAGCKPEYFPTVLASVEAAAGGQFPLHGSIATTAGLAPMMVVNGPVREQIGMNWGLNALGQGNRANSTLGRALRLMLRNVGGAVPGEIEQAIQGGGHKWTLSYAEYEAYSPWEPFHVEYGYESDDSVVSLLAITGGPRVCIDQTSRDARALTGSLAMAFQQVLKPRGQVTPVDVRDQSRTCRRLSIQRMVQRQHPRGDHGVHRTAAARASRHADHGRRDQRVSARTTRSDRARPGHATIQSCRSVIHRDHGRRQSRGKVDQHLPGNLWRRQPAPIAWNFCPAIGACSILSDS